MFDKSLLCYFVGVLILIQNINAEEEKCSYVETTLAGKLIINDNHIVTESITCKTDNTKIADGEYDCNTFFTLKVEKSIFTYSFDDKYKNFEEYIFNGSKVSDVTSYKRSGNTFEMIGTCSVKGASKDITITYVITDFNNHNPTFETLSKEFTAAIPIMPGFDVTLDNPIDVYDIDLTTSKVTVTIDKVNDKDYFKSKMIDGLPQHFPFRIVNVNPWVENKAIELHLTAEDQDGKKSDNPLIVKVKIDQDILLDTPKFEHRIYQLTNKDGTIDQEIKYDTKKKVTVTTFGNDKDSFEVDKNDDTKTLHVKAKNLPDKEIITLGITITSDFSDSCTVIVTSKVQNDLKFDNEFYLANYTLDNNLEFQSDIKVIASQDFKDITVTPSDYAEYFDVKYANKLVTVTVIKGKDLHDLKEDLINLPLKVESKTASLFNVAHLLINVQSKSDDNELHFDKSIYTANYNIKDDITKATINLVDEIKIIKPKNVDKVDITIDADCKGCQFAVDQNDKITISVKKPLEQDFLEVNRHLVAKIKAVAVNDKSINCEAAINMNLDEIKGPLFSFPLYKATYNTTDKKVIKSDKISIKTVGTDKLIVNIADSDYKDNFKVTPKDDGWILQETDKALDVKDDAILVPLTAKENDYPKTSTAQVIVSLVNENKVIEDTFKFKQSLYKAEYTILDGDIKKGKITLKEKIDFEGLKKDAIAEIKVIDSSFSVKNDGKDYVLTVDEPLDIKTLESNKKIVYKLQATDPDANKCEAALELAVTNVFGPTFTKNTFLAIYNSTSKDLEKAESITIASVRNEKNVKFEIEDKYKKSLQVVQDGKNYKLTLVKANPLDVGQDKLILISMEVSEDNWVKDKESKAKIVLQIVNENSPPIPKLEFVKSLLEVEYKVDKKTEQVTINGSEIEMKNVFKPEEVNFKVDGDYETSFGFAYDVDNKWKIKQGKDPLPLKKIDDNPLVLKIVAIEGENSAESVLSVTLPEKKKNDNDDDKGGDNTALIVVVAVLAVLLVGYVVGTGLFYVLKIRKQLKTDPDEELEAYAKKRNLTSQTKQPVEAVRRPTGMVFGLPIDEDDDDDDDQAEGPSEERERRKSVVFNENVEEMKIDTTSLNDNNGGDTASEKSLEKDD